MDIQSTERIWYVNECVMSVYLPPSLGFWPKWRSIPSWVRCPSWWAVSGVIIIRVCRWGRSRWEVVLGLLRLETSCIRVMGEIIPSPLSIVFHRLPMNLHISIELILQKWPAFPAIKIKQRQCRQTNYSIRLNYSPTWFLRSEERRVGKECRL